MSRIFNRPMFKRGGSAGQGITSGLNRPGYANGLDVQKVKELRDQTLGMYGQPPRGYGVYDFLTDWGLRMASATPKGNVLQTAASEAIEPHEKLMAGKSEAEMAEYLAGIKATDLSISSLTDIAAATAKASELNKDFSKIRRIENATDKIQSGAAPNSWESIRANAAKKARAEITINDYYDAGVTNLAQIPNISDEISFKFDLQSLDPDKIWFHPDKSEWLVISQVDEGGTTVNKEKSFTNIDDAIKFQTQKKTIDSIDKESIVGDKKKEVVDWDIDIEKEKFKDVTKYTEKYLRNQFDAYVRKIKSIVEADITTAASQGSQAMPSISAEDTVFWRNYKKDPERAYQRWKNKITSFGKKQKTQMDLSEKIGANINYGIKKADGGLMRNIRNIDEESANELQAWWDSQRFTN